MPVAKVVNDYERHAARGIPMPSELPTSDGNLSVIYRGFVYHFKQVSVGAIDKSKGIWETRLVLALWLGGFVNLEPGQDTPPMPTNREIAAVLEAMTRVHWSGLIVGDVRQPPTFAEFNIDYAISQEHRERMGENGAGVYAICQITCTTFRPPNRMTVMYDNGAFNIADPEPPAE